MSKNRHLAIYPYHPIHDIVFSSKDLSPLTLTEVDSFRSCNFTVLSFHSLHPTLNIRTCYVVNSEF